LVHRALVKFGRTKRQKFGAISNNFRLWSQFANISEA